MIEEILRGAQIRTPVYTVEQRAEDDRRLYERIEKMTRRRNRAARDRSCGWLTPTSPALAKALVLGDEEDRLTDRVEGDLKHLCQLVLHNPRSREHLVEFVEASSPADATGARSLGCLLWSAGHPDDARFWWRYAAGSGDATAAYLLFLEGLLRKEPYEAVFCYRKYGAGAFLNDEDWQRPRPGPVEAVKEQEVDLLELDTGSEGQVSTVRVPGGYPEFSEDERDELLCHH
jgi:hypothetical protein